MFEDDGSVSPFFLAAIAAAVIVALFYVLA